MNTPRIVSVDAQVYTTTLSVVEEVLRSFTLVKVEILSSQNNPLQVEVLNSDVIHVKVLKYYLQNVLYV